MWPWVNVNIVEWVHGMVHPSFWRGEVKAALQIGEWDARCECAMRMRDANARCECADYHPFWPSTKSKRPLPCADPSGDCGEGGDCHPQCQRKCSSPACNQVCGTICEQPRCSTCCQELGCSKLKCAIKRVSMSHRMHKSNTSLQVSLWGTIMWLEMSSSSWL